MLYGLVPVLQELFCQAVEPLKLLSYPSYPLAPWQLEMLVLRIVTPELHSRSILRMMLPALQEDFVLGLRFHASCAHPQNKAPGQSKVWLALTRVYRRNTMNAETGMTIIL